MATVLALNITLTVFTRVMLVSTGVSCRHVSVCLSICPSVTSRCSTKTAKRSVMQTVPHDSPGSFLMPKISAELKRGHFTFWTKFGLSRKAWFHVKIKLF